MKRMQTILLFFFLICCLILSACGLTDGITTSLDLSEVPAFSDSPYVVINGNIPEFEESELTTESFEEYSELDSLNRCGVAYANISTELMPTEDRGSIGQVKPTGWQTVKYDCIDGKYLYNRCHLIGYQLTAENANVQNLITGTRYLNVEGMLPFENMVADYIKETGNHVLYRVTPIFEENNLVANGVQMEALSVEDKGEGICFNVFCYNNQPGIVIDYTTGNSYEVGTTTEDSSGDETYILNTSSKKFHNVICGKADDISKSNRETYTGKREALIVQGYSPCGNCKP